MFNHWLNVLDQSQDSTLAATPRLALHCLPLEVDNLKNKSVITNGIYAPQQSATIMLLSPPDYFSV